MVCPKCKAHLNNGSTFCSACGVKINNNNALATLKKPVYKQWWFWAIIVIFLTSGVFSIISNTRSVRDYSDELAMLPPPPIPFGDETSIVVSSDEGLEALVDVIDANLSLEFVPNEYLISATDESIIVYFKIPGLSHEASKALNGSAESEWENAKQEFAILRKEIQNTAIASGRHDPIIIVVMNELNKNNDGIILAISHGDIIYDAADSRFNPQS